jgi:hypothetical protein
MKLYIIMENKTQNDVSATEGIGVTEMHQIKDEWVSVSVFDRKDGTMQASIKPLKEHVEKIEKIREEDPQTFDIEMDEKISQEVGYEVETESNYDTEITGQPDIYGNGWLFYFKKGGNI